MKSESLIKSEKKEFFIIETYSKESKSYYYYNVHSSCMWDFDDASQFLTSNIANEELKSVCKKDSDIDYEKSKIVKITFSTVVEEIIK